jgi:hypothetical protein
MSESKGDETVVGIVVFTVAVMVCMEDGFVMGVVKCLFGVAAVET